MLKEKGHDVRGFVRNVTKARELLKCQKCDASEGIYVGDVTKADDLIEPMKGDTGLAIATSAIPHCDLTKPKLGHVVFISSMGTTEPDSFLDKLGDGQIGFYKLNAEAALIDSGLP